jgi:hypothetical protein
MRIFSLLLSHLLFDRIDSHCITFFDCNVVIFRQYNQVRSTSTYIYPKIVSGGHERRKKYLNFSEGAGKRQILNKFEELNY